MSGAGSRAGSRFANSRGGGGAAAGSAAVVRLTGVGHHFGAHPALEGISLAVRRGERVAVLGPSGAGKSTLLGVLGGWITPDRGDVQVLGSNPGQLTGAALRAHRVQVGTISQALDLVDQVRVAHNVKAGHLGSWSLGRSLVALTRTRPDADCAAALERVGLGWAAQTRTGQLSGGERQRVAIARLLVQRPHLVLADEPTASLDPSHASDILNLLAGSRDDVTVIVSLHQPELARVHCDRIIGLRHGRLVLDAPAASVTSADFGELYLRA